MVIHPIQAHESDALFSGLSALSHEGCIVGIRSINGRQVIDASQPSRALSELAHAESYANFVLNFLPRVDHEFPRISVGLEGSILDTRPRVGEPPPHLAA